MPTSMFDGDAFPPSPEVEFLGFPRTLIEAGEKKMVVVAPMRPISITGLAFSRECADVFIIDELRVGVQIIVGMGGSIIASAFEAPGRALPDSNVIFPGMNISLTVENISAMSYWLSAWLAFVPSDVRAPIPQVIVSSVPKPPPPPMGRELPSRKFSFDEE